MQPSAGSWLLPVPKVQLNSDAVKLLCVPQAGMGAWVYQSWSVRLAPEVQVLPVELPGHGTRMREPRVTDLCALSSQIVDALQDNILCGSYALFGHSMGAWIVWEVLKELTRRGLPLPLHLYVSGNRAPHLCGAADDIDSTRMHKLVPADFWAAMQRRYGVNPHLEDPHIQAFMYPMLKDDFTLVETYQPSALDTPTTVPITAVGARRDNRYKPEQITAWSKHAAGHFEELWLEDLGHNYIDHAPDTLLTTIKAQLLSSRCGATTAMGR